MPKIKITFLFPARCFTPTGGYKVVYEYANRLTKDGYEVTLIYPCFLYDFKRRGFLNVLRYIKAFITYLKTIIHKPNYASNWFNLNEKVKERTVISLHHNFIPKSDIYIATAVQTAMSLNKNPCSNNKKYYLIQDFESWNGITPEMVIQTYNYNMRSIVISTWLKEIVEKYNSECTLIPNGFDFNYFKTYIHPQNRNKYSIALLYHTDERKGVNDSLNALNIVKELYPDLHVNAFGVPKRPVNMPDWFTYYQRPDKDTLNKIYNESSIFIGASIVEGWGLTIGEAMICSCAVACTDNNGFKEMAIDNETALLSPIKQSQELAKNIIRLIEDRELRVRIALNGNKYIQEFNWEKSYNKFKEYLGI